MLVSLTVGKVDAGVAILMTEDNRIVSWTPSPIYGPPSSFDRDPAPPLANEFSSYDALLYTIFLASDEPQTIVDITVSWNQAAEAANASAFQSLQKRILHTYGIHTPSPPVLRLRNATQTSLVLEWDPINLATASLKSLSLYRNDSKAGSIPRPMEMLSTKISGLAIDTEYTFYLVLRTSAGTFSSERLVCRTHKMTDLSGITVTPGVLPPALRTSLGNAVERIGAKLIDTVRIDTTHFVCTEGRGPAWEKAVEMNIPVVRPEWVEGCEREGTIVSVRGYYLNADPKLRQLGPNVHSQQNRQQAHLNPSGSVSSGRASQNSGSRSEEPPAEKELPTTPFPGSSTNGRSEADRSDEEGSEDEEKESPPPPPAKDDQENTKPKQDDAESTDGEAAETGANDGNTENGDDSNPLASMNGDITNRPRSLSQRKQKNPRSSSPSPSNQKENGNGGEGELDEVPL
ncbi:Chitin synthase, class 5 [Onygenales sp. PD_40]|nr:Chitin synthase, class 5 [Onygenales sp. PD_40]